MVAICTTLSLTSCGKSAKKDYTMYIKDEGVNISDSEEGSQVWQLTDSPANSELYRYDVLWEDVSDDLVRISEDGKYIFYVENLNLFQEEYGSRWSFALYYREVDKPEEEAILIASDVLHYEVNSKELSLLIAIVTMICINTKLEKVLRKRLKAGFEILMLPATAKQLDVGEERQYTAH